MITIPNCPTCGNAPLYYASSRLARCHLCRMEHDERHGWIAFIPDAEIAAARIDTAPPPESAVWRETWSADESGPRHVLVSGAPVRPSPPQTVAAREIAAAKPPRFVVMRGADLDGHLSIGPFLDAFAAHSGVADIEDGTAGYVGARYWNRRDQRGGPPWKGWFIVDTEAPRVPHGAIVTYGGCFDDDSPRATAVDAPPATYRSRPIPADDLSAAARANVDYLWAAQARELMQTPLRDARRKRATIETIAPPPPGVPVEYPVTIANAPPTDEEMVEAVEAHMKRSEDACYLGSLDVNGVTVHEPELRAAWSRVLAAKVATSDEKRRRDAMVYGPIDDLDEV